MKKIEEFFPIPENKVKVKNARAVVLARIEDSISASFKKIGVQGGYYNKPNIIIKIYLKMEIFLVTIIIKERSYIPLKILLKKSWEKQLIDLGKLEKMIKVII